MRDDFDTDNDWFLIDTKPGRIIWVDEPEEFEVFDTLNAKCTVTLKDTRPFWRCIVGIYDDRLREMNSCN